MLLAASSWPWYLSRASACVTLVLLTFATLLGILTTTRLGVPWWPRFASAELHRRVSLLCFVFLVVHIASTVFDSYVSISVLASVVPLASTYHPLSVGLGALAFDCLLVVLVSSLLRARIPANAWRALHYLAYVSLPIAWVHVWLLGTDLHTSSHWLALVLLGSVVSIVLVGLGRLARAWRYRHLDTAPPPKVVSR